MKYTNHLINSFYTSPHTGTISGADIVNRVVNKETGDAVKLYLILEDGKIKDAKFQACGSVVLFASLSAIMDIIIGNTLEEALAVTEKSVIKEIKQVNRCDYSMVAFAVKALSVTLNNYLKKLEKGSLNKVSKPARVKTLHASKEISVFSNQNKTNNEFENVYSNMLEETQSNEPMQKTPKVSNKKTKKETVVLTQESQNEDEDSELAILTPVKPEVIEAVPTKIEVRVLDDEDIESEDSKPEEKETQIKLIKRERITPEYISTNEEQDRNEDVIDEIDSITAKLTDAITKLNFKFDVDNE